MGINPLHLKFIVRVCMLPGLFILRQAIRLIFDVA